MIEFTLRHALNCTPAHQWKLHFDPEWTRTLIVDGLGFESCDVKPVRQDGTIRHRDMVVTPKVDLPGPVRKLLGDRLGYTEKATFDETTERWKYTMVLNVLAEKIRLGGEMWFEPLGDDRCTRVSQMYVDVKIFGLGGMVEKAAEKNMRDGWGRSADWVNAWLKDHPESSG